MVALGNNLATWLAACAFFVFAFDFIKGKGYRNLNLIDLKPALPLFIGTLLLGSALFGLCHLLGLALAGQIIPFILGLAATFLVCTFKLENKSRSLLLLGSAVLAYISLAPSGDDTFKYIGLVSYVVGILSWGLCANFLLPGERSLAAIAPAVLFVSGQICVSTFNSDNAQHVAQDLVNSAFISSIMVNWFQRPFRSDDKWLLKRLILTATGGLIFLILVTKVILAPQYAPMAMLVAGGFAMSYVLDGQGVRVGSAVDTSSLDLIRNVLLIGIFTLISTRLYGNLGLIVIGATIPVSFFSQMPAVAGLFVAARSLEQAFDSAFVQNVTGINLMHPYVSAAQYFGFFTVIALMLLLKEGRGRKFETAAVTLVGVVGPALTNYFLHAEASASYLVGLTVAGVMVSILGQRFFVESEEACASLMVVAAQASAVGLLTGEMIQIGIDTANTERLHVVYALAGIAALVLVFSILRSRASSPGAGPAPDSNAGAG